ncbi:MAG: sulfurtransferase TusA family protein [Pseudomonadota bacterium]|nr:sulfurtransferase TusA family protein [Pseudomonadota bacterium]
MKGAHRELDVTGLSCPMPLLKAKLALNELAPLQILKVVATDPASEKDFSLFVERSDHRILEFQNVEGVYTFWIQRG